MALDVTKDVTHRNDGRLEHFSNEQSVHGWDQRPLVVLQGITERSNVSSKNRRNNPEREGEFDVKTCLPGSFILMRLKQTDQPQQDRDKGRRCLRYSETGLNAGVRSGF